MTRCAQHEAGTNPKLAVAWRSAYSGFVSIEALKTEVQALPADERRKLMAFMVVLEDAAQTDYAAKLASRISDKSPERWLTPEQCEREFGLSAGKK
jgi:hypothetical protein